MDDDKIEAVARELSDTYFEKLYEIANIWGSKKGPPRWDDEADLSSEHRDAFRRAIGEVAEKGLVVLP